MAHRFAGGGAVPVALARGDDEHVADGDALLGLPFHLDDALALGDNQHLIEGMAVELVHRAILERDDANANLLGIPFADDVLPLDRPDEEISGRRHALVWTHTHDLHGGPSS